MKICDGDTQLDYYYGKSGSIHINIYVYMKMKNKQQKKNVFQQMK